MTEELETIAPPEAPLDGANDRIFEMLDSVERTVRDSRVFVELGVDTELVRAFREYLRDPQAAWDSMTEHFGNLFVLFFWEEARKRQLGEHVLKMGAGLNGSRVDLWVYLKDDSYNFSTRAKFYELNADLSNSRAFSKIDADLHVLRRDDLELPATYTSITF